MLQLVGLQQLQYAHRYHQKGEDMRALITGGAGFIGSHLADYLLGIGWVVDALDNLSTGCEANIRHLLPEPDFHFSHGSTLDHALLEDLVRNADVVFHLAATVGTQLVLSNPLEVLRNNARSTEAVLEFCSTYNKKLLIASSSEVYGNIGCLSLREDSNLLIGPPSESRWSYAVTKIADEFLATAYHRQKGLSVVVARLFNIIGPRQRCKHGMVVPCFFSRAMSDESIDVYGTGQQKRSFTWIKDLVWALTKLIQESAAYGEIVNIGTAESISILELAQLVKKITQSHSRIQLVPYKAAYREGFRDTLSPLPDISKVRALINYSPTLSLPEMLTRIADSWNE
jgi:nucleoside-diphosphate-sugar epimerase